MKKGDDRRKNIIDAGERLFYANGYEQTSVQDILDALNLSKGGFYHHFASKLQLLEEICDRRSLLMREGMRAAVNACRGSAVDKLNALFTHAGFWQGESADFTALMLGVAYLGGSAVLRDRLRRMTVDNALPLAEELIWQGVAQKQIFTRYPSQIGELLLDVYANLMDEVAAAAVEGPADERKLVATLAKLEVYRHSAELLLGAPYGSVVIVELGRVKQLFALGELSRLKTDQILPGPRAALRGEG